MPKRAPEAFQNPVRQPPKPPKIEARGALSSQHAPKSAQETPKRPPRGPRAAQESPKASQVHPRAAPEGPRPLQNRARGPPRQVFSTILVESAVRQASGSNFARFWRRALEGRHAFRIGFSNTKRMSGLFRIACVRGQRNIEKEGLGASKTVPGPSQNSPKSSKSAPRRVKTSRKRQQTQQEAQNAPKKRPRAKNEPTWVQHGRRGFGIFDPLACRPPPLR